MAMMCGVERTLTSPEFAMALSTTPNDGIETPSSCADCGTSGPRMPTARPVSRLLGSSALVCASKPKRLRAPSSGASGTPPWKERPRLLERCTLSSMITASMKTCRGETSSRWITRRSAT